MHAIQKLLNVFDNQEIEITYKNYSTLDTWATLMKQKLNYSQYVEQEQGIFRYVKNSELTREIRCHSDRMFPNLHQCHQWYSAPPPPFRIMFCFKPFCQCLRVFQDVVKFWHDCNLRLPFHLLVRDFANGCKLRNSSFRPNERFENINAILVMKFVLINRFRFSSEISKERNWAWK